MEKTDSTWPALNDTQKEAVFAPICPQLIVAGPGTGKTRVLVCRAAHLIKDKERKPSSITLVTFTARAAGELTERLTSIVGEKAESVRAGTLHHFCFDILREHSSAADVPENFVVADQAMTDPFWQQWYENHQEWAEKEDIGSYRQLKTHVSRIKMGIDSVTGPLQGGLKEYRAALQKRGAIDFDDLLTRARDLLEESPEIRSRLGDETGAILIDEFQDTDPVQYRILKRLGREGVHLYCVADGDQSVYRFRGARPENIRRFAEDFGCTGDQRHVLKENYRTSRAIYKVAEGVLPEEDRLKDRGDISPRKKSSEPVYIAPKGNRKRERAFVRRLVQKRIEEGADREDIAVITRWNSRLRELEQDFLEEGIACHASSNEDLLDLPPARKLRQLLRVVDARRRGHSVANPITQLLGEVLPEAVFARLQDFGERAMPDKNMWTVFQTVVSSGRARRSAQLQKEERLLKRMYATINNLLRRSEEEGGITIGEYISYALSELEDPLQLLSSQKSRLTDPIQFPDVQAASQVLREWAENNLNGASPGEEQENGRLLVHHDTPEITRLWRQLMRRALGVESDPPAPLPGKQEALFLRPADEGIPPLGEGDLAITTDLTALVSWGERTGAFSKERGSEGESGGMPEIIVLSKEERANGMQTLPLGIEPDSVYPVGESASNKKASTQETSTEEGSTEEGSTEKESTASLSSPSVRLMKLLQATTGPEGGTPPFPEYVMVDIEATSTNPTACHVAEIAAIKVKGGETADTFSRLVGLPPDLTEEEADTLRNVCGLDPESDFDGASPKEEVWEDFCSFVGERPLVAYNGQGYDFRVLRRLDRELQGEARWTTTYDMLPAAHELYPNRDRYDAETMRQDLLGESKSTSHRALEDARDQKRLLEKMQERRAAQRRLFRHEPLLPLVVAALTYEDTAPQALSADGAAFLQVGQMWALRDASPASQDLSDLLPRALPDRVRQKEIYQRIDEEALHGENSEGIQPGLKRRLQALIDPYRQSPLQGPATEDLLNHLALWGEEESLRKGGVVSLSTYHSAKGLEFEHVICMDVHGGAFPPYFARDPEQRKEGRRLLYVGMTRAEESLVLTYPKVERGHERRPSPFLKEVPREFIERAPESLTQSIYNE